MSIVWLWQNVRVDETSHETKNRRACEWSTSVVPGGVMVGALTGGSAPGLNIVSAAIRKQW